jgi:hypothetical protein
MKVIEGVFDASRKEDCPDFSAMVRIEGEKCVS